MSAKLNEKIQKLIDEIGFNETCERLQLKSYDMIRLFRLPIESRYVERLLSELFEDDKLPKQYEEFTIMNFDTENHANKQSEKDKLLKNLYQNESACALFNSSRT
jgi:uncharacterized protein YozE (UPF0346 family)